MAKSTTVIDRDGVKGTVVTNAPDADNIQGRVRVRREHGPLVLLPEEMLILGQDGQYHASSRFADLEQTLEAEAATDHTVIPLVAEELEVGRRMRETGRVRVTKVIHEEEQTIDEPILREEVRVERVPMDEIVDAPVEQYYDGDTLVIPIMEETLVVEKRWRVKEELRLTKHRVTAEEPQRVTLRREEAVVERIPPEGGETQQQEQQSGVGSGGATPRRGT